MAEKRRYEYRRLLETDRKASEDPKRGVSQGVARLGRAARGHRGRLCESGDNGKRRLYVGLPENSLFGANEYQGSRGRHE